MQWIHNFDSILSQNAGEKKFLSKHKYKFLSTQKTKETRDDPLDTKKKKSGLQHMIQVGNIADSQFEYFDF